MDAYGYYTTLREQCPEIQEFYSGKDSIWKGWGATGLEDNYHANAEITASFFERVLAQYGLADVLRVKRDSKGSVECIMEAWVSVDILQISSNWPAGFQIGSGILTWPNSD